MNATDIINKLANTFRAAAAEKPEYGLSMIISGKPEHGNCRVRLYGEGENILAAAVYRHDLWLAEQESPEAVDQYLKLLPFGNQPWTEIPGPGLVKLVNIPRIVQRDPESTLKASWFVSDVMFGVFEEVGWQHAFLRQWRAGNGGTGVEVVIVVCDENGKRICFELVMNYYYHFDSEALVKRLKVANDK